MKKSSNPMKTEKGKLRNENNYFGELLLVKNLLT